MDLIIKFLGIIIAIVVVSLVIWLMFFLIDNYRAATYMYEHFKTPLFKMGSEASHNKYGKIEIGRSSVVTVENGNKVMYQRMYSIKTDSGEYIESEDQLINNVSFLKND